MAVNITRLDNGNVDVQYDGKQPVSYSNLTNVRVITSLLGWIQLDWETGLIRFKYNEIGLINGDPKPGTIEETGELLRNDVFFNGGGSGGGATYQLLSEKGQPNGYASLDGGAKIPTSQLPDSIVGQVSYQGVWNANTNTPTLVSPPAANTKGHYYITSVAGTRFGITFDVGDWIISSGTTWSKVDNTDAVSTVFGRLGNILANESDYSSFYPLLAGGSTITSSGTAVVGLTVKAITGQTVNVQEWRSANDVITNRIANSGTFVNTTNINTGDIRNLTSAGNAQITLPNTGVVITRNIADANSALQVNLANAGSTAAIQEFQFTGTTVASVSKEGIITSKGESIVPAAIGQVGLTVRAMPSQSVPLAEFQNSAGTVGVSINNAGNVISGPSSSFTSYYGVNGTALGLLQLNSAGPIITRNAADTVTTFRVNQIHASATGLIQEWQASGTTVASVARTGDVEIINATAGIILKDAGDGSRRRITVNNGVLTVSAAL